MTDYFGLSVRSYQNLEYVIGTTPGKSKLIDCADKLF